MSFFRVATKLLYLRARKPVDSITSNYAIYGAGETGILVKRKIEEFAGGKLKESGTEHWVINYYGTNNYNFSALPNGIRCDDGAFCNLACNSNWWTNTYLPPRGCYPGGGITRSLYGEDFGFYQNQLKRFGMKYFYGLSVRCLKN
jgi:uncharacterized protein (TIGR02145 family)